MTPFPPRHRRQISLPHRCPFPLPPTVRTPTVRWRQSHLWPYRIPLRHAIVRLSSIPQSRCHQVVDAPSPPRHCRRCATTGFLSSTPSSGRRQSLVFRYPSRRHQDPSPLQAIDPAREQGHRRAVATWSPLRLLSAPYLNSPTTGRSQWRCGLCLV